MVIALVFLLWIAVALLTIAVLALARQVRVLNERVAPPGPLFADVPSPADGEPAPAKAHPNGAALERDTLFLFVAPDCPVSRAITPVAASLATRAALGFVLVDEAEQAAAALGRDVPDSERPFAALIRADGAILSQGPLSSREQLEHLLAARAAGRRPAIAA